jgi:hypothetical protein
MLDQASSSALLALYTARTVALVLLLAGLGLVCLVAGLHAHHKYKQLKEGFDSGVFALLWHMPARDARNQAASLVSSFNKVKSMSVLRIFNNKPAQ